MVAVDAQILGGVAVTVLLALLFFGVVVLWDVALAIRGVADKIDKLEDTVDDDLTEMERAVSGASGGGGPQVHLSGGGTITSGGSSGAQAGPHPSSRPDNPAGDPATDRRSPRTERTHSEHADVTRADASSTASDQSEPSDATERESHGRTDAERQRSRQSVGADPTPVRSAAETAAWSDAEEVANAETGSADEGSTASTDGTPNRGDSTPNSGRFITSPDRTPWYRTRIDWDAVVDGRSPIAGELEAGNVEPTPTDTDGDETDPSDEPIVVDPDGAATTEATPRDSQEANDWDDDASGESDGTDGLEAEDDRTDEPSSPDGNAEASPKDDADTKIDAAGERADSASSTAESSTSGEAESAETSDSETETLDSITTEPAKTETDGDDVDVIGTGGDDVGEDDFDFGATGTDESHPATDEIEPSDDEAAAEESTTAVEPVPSESDTVEAVDGEADDQLDEAEATDAQSGEIDETPDMEFTFEEFSPDDTSEPSLTVDDAVEAVNESNPSLSRSAHGVTSSAEKDDDGVVLVYDLETADAGQSTKRLLTYQLQSFANESDVDVDVSVAGNRIVVDIPDAEGTDVSQWEAAIVEVIDRTLYLSDSN
ncbi:AAA family ATPase [Halovivax asiaticus]|nr:AAA family ATPase [Halovivax asiaticus]